MNIFQKNHDGVMMEHNDHFLAALSFEEKREKKETTELVQVLFLLGFGETC